jgi:hypothetical protein
MIYYSTMHDGGQYAQSGSEGQSFPESVFITAGSNIYT